MSDVMGPPRDIATVFRGHASMSSSPSGTNLLAPGSPCSNGIQRTRPHPCGGLDPSWWLSMGTGVVGHSRDGCWVPPAPWGGNLAGDPSPATHW